MALKLTQNSTGKTWSSGSKKEEKKEERQKTTGASAPVEEKYSSPSGKLTLTRTSTSTSTPADDPNLLERIGKTLSGTGRRQVSGYAGAAENLMENIRRLDSLNSAEHRKAQQEQENAAHYREMLARGTMDDGTVIDAAQRARLEKLLTSAENRAKVYQQSNEAIHQPISGLIEKTDAYGDRVGAASEADLQRAKQGAGVVGRTLVDAGSALTDVLADAAANVVLPGLGTAGRVARSYGHGAEAAEDKGFDLAQQNLYGGGSAALGELANRMFSSNPILQKAFGNGALDDILLPGLEKSLPGSIVKSAFGEALEEGSENIGDYFLQRAIMGDQADEFSWKDVGYDALIGGLVGGVTGVSRGRGSQNLQNQETDSHGSQNRAADAAPAKSSTPADGNSMGKTENVSEGLKTASANTEAKQQPLPSPADRRASVMETAKQTLGKEGYRMFEAAYRDSDDPATSYSELTRAYNDGLVNRKTGSRVLSEGQYESMFEAGRVDAAANVAAQSKLAAKETTFNRKDSGIDYSDAMTSEYVKGVDKQTVKVVDTVAKTLGLKVRFADSVDGGSANAQIQSGIITIEKNNPHPLRSIFGHEITHRMQDLAPAEYARLREAVAQSGWTNAAIQMTRDKYAEHGRSIGNEAALDEAVADYVGALLEDSGEMERFIRKYQNDRTLLEKLRDLVRDLARKLKGSGYDANLRNAEKQLSKVLDAAAAQVKTNVNVDVNANVGVHVDTKTESASPRDSLKTWNESEYVKARDAAAKELAEALGISQKKAKDYIDSVNSIAKMIADDQARLDYEASPGRSSFVSNSEYGGSFDFSTLCKKRRLLTGTFTAIQKALPNTALTADEILEIRNMMAEQGLEVSCGLCYVEGSRANMGGFAQQFIELYKKYNPGKWYPDMAEMNTPDGIEWVRINHPEVYEQYEYFWNHHGQLRDGDPSLFASRQKPKLYQLHTEYKGEILTHFKKGDSVEQKNKNGGVRLQSFSDFEIVHLLDTMQVITDMARVGLAGQAYTKVPDFAWALGDTGLKINLSLIAKDVDENGKLVFDEREGMAIADAMALRDRYSENVGTIIVAFNDAQLKAAMADDRIDFIIPFHRSQWKKSQYKAMGLPAKTKDYTNQQNEKLIQKTYHEYRGRMVPDKATNFMPNTYWDFSKSGKENAEHYLEMCAQNNKRPKFYKFLKNNGDGSYSLQPDGSTDGYWKLLIDFKMYDNDGNGAPQRPVWPAFNMEECQRMLDEYSGGHANFPVAHGIVDEFVDKYKKEHPKTRYSLKDSAGRDLSEGQKEYFKDSKVRDADGNLKVMYHGTNTPNFTVFDPSFSDDGVSLFFTDSPNVADSYTHVQLGGADIDPYRLPNTIKTLDEYNQYMEDIGSETRIVKITTEIIEQEQAKVDEEIARINSRKNQFNGKRIENLQKRMDELRAAEGKYVQRRSGEVYITRKAFDTAEALIEDRVSDPYWLTNDFGNRYKVYLNLTNPYVLDTGNHVRGSGEIHVRRNASGSMSAEIEVDDETYTIRSKEGESAEDFVQRFLKNESDIALYREKEQQSREHLIKEWMDLGDTRDKVITDLDRFGWEYSFEVYDVHLDFIEPGIWKSLDFEGNHGNTRAVAKWAKEHGYDGVVFKNLKDIGGFSGGTVNEAATVVIAFDSNQVKATNNLNPTSNTDIRYSLKDSESLAREIARIQKEGRAQKRSEADVQADIRKVVEEAYAGMVEEYGAIDPGERAARDVQVPKKTGKGKKVSQTVRTAMEAAATPDEALPDIQKLVATGEFSYDVYTDKQAIADATSTIEKGWAKALADWTAAVKKGEVSKKNTAMGWALYNNAVNSGDTKTALTVLDYMVKHQRNAAQALQATRILKKLSPETQLYQIQRSVDSLQEELNKRSGGETVDEATAKRAAGAVGQAKQKAADVAANAHANVKVRRRGNRVTVEGNQAGEPFVFEYAQKVGEALANSLEAKRNRTAKEKTFLQHIVSELNRFASEKLPKEKKGTPLTAIDLLRDYIQNQSFYAEAWEAAQSELRSKYADDPVLGEFINSSIGVDANTNPQNAIFMRALVKAAADSGEGRSVLRRQEALGFTGMADTIADNLIRQTGATDEMADTIRDAAHAYVYDAVSDVRANEKNTNDIKIVDGAIRSAMKDIGVKLADVVTSGTGESAQQAIVAKLVGKYGFGMAEATRTAEIVAERFSHMSKQYAENRLKSMFKERSKTRKTIPDKIELLARLGAFDAGSAYNQLAAERIFKAGTPLAIDEKLAAKFLKAKTQEERDEVMKDIYRDVGRQMPSRFIDKWNAWRYLAMLGNPRTHVRNVVGNAGFAPIVATKNATATFIEWAVNGVSHGKLNRSKSMVGFGKADRALLAAAWADFAKVEDIIMGSGKYSDAANPNQYIEEGRQIFKLKPLEAARKGNTSAMNVEDKWFSRPHYAAALASYCKQHGLSPEQIQRGKETKNARTYAIREAQKATYRDTNALSQTISELGRPSADETNPVKKGVGVVMEGILPFRKTPANILARGLEYSPMGLLNGIKQAVWDVKRGKKTGAEAIDSIAAGLTGTGLLRLGMYLAAEGLIRGHGSDDEDENEFKELMGHQAYALEIGNESYTLDWLAPEALPFFVGVNLWEQTRGSDEEVTLSAMLNAVKTVTEPLLEMSCLQSLNDVFDSVGYATSDGLDGLPAALASAATSYLTQALPTLLGQAERTGEDVRMTTYTEKNDFLTSDLQYTLGKASARIPGPEYQQIPYIDAWGRTESSGAVGERAVNNFLNPAYTSEIQTSAMEEELLRLYEKTGKGKILPSRAAKYFNVGGDRKDLTAEEYVKYAQKKGQTSYSLLTGLTKSSTYKGMEPSDQVDAISKCYEYANAVAKASVSDFKPDGWVAKGISASSTTGIKAEQYVTLYIQQGKISSLKNAKGETIDNSKCLQIMQMIYNTPGLTEKQREQLFLDFGVGKTIRHYNKALVDQKLKVMEQMAK